MRSLISILCLGAVACSPSPQSNIKTLISGTVLEPTISASPTKREVKSLDLAKSNVTYLLGEVTDTSVSTIIQDLEKFNKQTQDVYLLINSPGGSVTAGSKLIGIMQGSSVKVNTVCLDLCASMAALIMEFGTVRVAVDRSTLMFHPASLSMGFQGELDKLFSRVGYYKSKVDKLDMEVAARSGHTFEQLKAKSTKELWIDAEDAVHEHLLDEIVFLKNAPPKPTYPLEENKLSKEIKLTM